MVDEQTRGRSRARNRDAHLQPAIRGGAPQFLRDRPRIAKQPFEAAQIERDLARPAHLDTRRELARHAFEHGTDQLPSAAYNAPNTVSPLRATESRRHGERH